MYADEVVRELILQHFRRSRHRGELESATVSAVGMNHVCGDEVRLQLRVEGDEIRLARFTGQGCSISQAAASMVAKAIEGRTLAEADEIAASFAEMLRGEAAASPALGELRALAGVGRLPGRIRCAMLPWDAFRSMRAEEDRAPPR